MVKMKKISGFTGNAPKLLKTGSLEYCLWTDSKGNLYFQITNNTETGEFSKLLFSVSSYASMRSSTDKLGNLKGFDLNTGKIVEHGNKDNGGFLKAILIDLLPKEE